MMKKLFFVLLTFAILAGMLANPYTGIVQAKTGNLVPNLEIDGLSISVDDTKYGSPESNVEYKITLTNSTSADISIDPVSIVPLYGGTWVVYVDTTSINVPAKGKAYVTANVAIPSGAVEGSNQVSQITFTATSAAVSGATTSVNITTWATKPSPPPTSEPLVVVDSYNAGGNPIVPGREFTLAIKFVNVGAGDAQNMVVGFEGTDFLPRGTGGIIAVPFLGSGKKVTVSQVMLANEALYGATFATIKVNVSYSNSAGTATTQSFTLTINLAEPQFYSGAATATPSVGSRPQLVVSAYKTNIDPLQPGTNFDLELEIHNLGTGDARSTTMVLGGGVTNNDQGTPQAGGISGGSGDVSNFAPLGSSNLVFLGDISANNGVKATPRFVVNVNTNPGAYSLKISFVYTDSKGNRLIDDQLITLLVYSLPQIEVGFYRDPGMFFVGQPSVLPIQVTNLGRKTAVMGNMKITSDNADVTNNVALVGVLEPGGYFTLDSNVIPGTAGQVALKITVTYTDDFNQPRSIEQVLNIDVLDAPIEPTQVLGPDGKPIEGDPGGMPTPENETFGQWFLRLIKGIFGLDSSPAQPEIPMEAPTEMIPIQPLPGGKG